MKNKIKLLDQFRTMIMDDDDDDKRFCKVDLKNVEWPNIMNWIFHFSGKKNGKDIFESLETNSIFNGQQQQ